MNNSFYDPGTIKPSVFKYNYVLRNNLFFIIVFLSCIIPCFMLVEYGRELLFYFNSAKTEGKIVSKIHRPEDSSLNRYRIGYTFTADGGAILRSYHSVGKNKYPRLSEGDAVTVRYERGNPSRSQPEGLSLLAAPFSYDMEFYLFPYIVGPLMLIAGFFFLSVIRKDMLHIKTLFTDGKPARGMITKAVFHKRDKRLMYYRLKYTFRTEQGRTYPGGFYYPCRYETQKHPDKGDGGTVLYYPEDPEQNIWIGSNWKEALPLTRRQGYPTEKDGEEPGEK